MTCVLEKSALRGVWKRGAQANCEMASTLEMLSWIAAIAAIPVTVIGWFVASGKKEVNKSVAQSGSLAISGDVVVDGHAGFVTGHNSPIDVNLTLTGSERDQYERRYAVYRATRALMDQAHRKLIPDETLNAFVAAQRDAAFLFDDEVVAYLAEVSRHARYLRGITQLMEDMPAGSQKAESATAAGKHRQWLLAQGDAILTEKFRRDLKFE
jgi:hypothetical protein